MIGKRSIEDNLFVVTQALPAAGANLTSASLDMANGPISNSPEAVEIVLEIPATPALVAAKNITLQVVESLDNVAFVNQPVIAPLVVAGGPGAAATLRFHLPSTAKRYIAVKATADAGAGDSTGVSFTLKAKF